MFCFPISDHVMVSQRTVSFKCRPRVSTCICMHNFDKTKGKFPGEHQVVWTGKNKTYKLKRSIPWHRLTSGLLQLTVEQLSTINKGKDYKKASTWSKQIENFINVSEPYSFRKPHTNNPHHLISTPPPPPAMDDVPYINTAQHNTVFILTNTKIWSKRFTCHIKQLLSINGILTERFTIQFKFQWNKPAAHFICAPCDKFLSLVFLWLTEKK